MEVGSFQIPLYFNPLLLWCWSHSFIYELLDSPTAFTTGKIIVDLGGVEIAFQIGGHVVEDIEVPRLHAQLSE